MRSSLVRTIGDTHSGIFNPTPIPNTANIATAQPNTTDLQEKMLDRLFPEDERNRIPEDTDEGGPKEVAVQLVTYAGVTALAAYAHFNLDIPQIMNQAYRSIEPFFSVLDRLENIPYQLPVATGSLAVMAAGVCIKIIDSYKK